MTYDIISAIEYLFFFALGVLLGYLIWGYAKGPTGPVFVKWRSEKFHIIQRFSECKQELKQAYPGVDPDGTLLYALVGDRMIVEIPSGVEWSYNLETHTAEHWNLYKEQIGHLMKIFQDNP